MSSMTASGREGGDAVAVLVGRGMAPPGEGHHPHAGGLGGHDAGRAVLDDQAGGGSVAEGRGGVQEEVGGGLAVGDHGRGEGAALEARPEAGDGERELDALGLRGGGDAVGAGQRVEGGGDVRDRLELGAEGGVEGAAHGVEGGVGEGDAVVAGDDLAGGGERAAEEEGVGLGGGQRDAGGGEGGEQQAQRDRLAVDEHAVAVEEDEAGASVTGRGSAERRVGAVGPEGAEPAGEGVAEGGRVGGGAVDVAHGEPGGGVGAGGLGLRRCRRSQFGSLGSMVAPQSVRPAQ